MRAQVAGNKPASGALGVVQADMAKLRRLGQIRPGAGFEYAEALIERVLKVAHSGVRHQSLTATAEELVEQRQVGAVVEHVGDDNQVEAVGLGEEVCGVTQLHIIERGIGL